MLVTRLSTCRRLNDADSSILMGSRGGHSLRCNYLICLLLCLTSVSSKSSIVFGNAIAHLLCSRLSLTVVCTLNFAWHIFNPGSLDMRLKRNKYESLPNYTVFRIFFFFLRGCKWWRSPLHLRLRRWDGSVVLGCSNAGGISKSLTQRGAPCVIDRGGYFPGAMASARVALFPDRSF